MEKSEQSAGDQRGIKKYKICSFAEDKMTIEAVDSDIGGNIHVYHYYRFLLRSE